MSPDGHAAHDARPGRLRTHLRRVLLAAGGLLAAAVPAPRAEAAPGVVAVAAEMSQEAGRTRLALTLSGPVATRTFALEGPDRIVVEAPGLNCQLPPEANRSRGGLVLALRCGFVAIGRSRLVIDLAAPARVTRLEQVDGKVAGATVLVLELARTDRDTFRQEAGRAPAEPRRDPDATGSIPGGARTDGRPLVAIDAGHGGIDPGARALTGDNEKDIVLAFAQALRDRLVAGGLVRVLMTRDGDVFVPLDDRVRLARSGGADLFVSIHADSITSPLVRGATIYTGAERATDLDSARLAERENASDTVAGLAPGQAAAGVGDILQDLTVRETRGFSHRFAAMLQGGLAPTTRFTVQPHREAGFRVLRAADMTSVLVELGYLSNQKDSDLLLSDDWRRRNTEAMASAIERFLRSRITVRAAVSP